MKKILLLLLILVSFVPMKAFAYDVVKDGLCYNILADNTAVLANVDTTYTGNLEIPDEIVYEGNKLKVVSISIRALENCKKLTSVDVPSTIAVIGSRAFSGCTSLNEIVIPAGVDYIGEDAFRAFRSLESISVAEILREYIENGREKTKVLDYISLPIPSSSLEEIIIGPLTDYNVVEHILRNELKECILNNVETTPSSVQIRS